MEGKGRDRGRDMGRDMVEGRDRGMDVVLREAEGVVGMVKVKGNNINSRGNSRGCSKNKG